MADTFKFPQFDMPGFPFLSLPDQLAAAFKPGSQQFSNGSQYGRWNGVNNNAFGLFPGQFASLFGSPAPQPMQFQPPWGNNGKLGSNQGPGSNPGMTPPPPPPGPPPGGPNTQAPPGSGAPIQGGSTGGGGMASGPLPTGPFMPAAPTIPPKQPVGGLLSTAPPIPLSGTTSVGPADYGSPPPNPAAPPPAPTPGGGGAISKSPLDGNTKMAMTTSPTHVSSDPRTYADQVSRFSPERIAGLLSNGNTVGAQFMQKYNNMAQPSNLTVPGFQQAMQSNPAQAFKMLQQGGQSFINAVMQQTGMTQDQINQFLNNAGYNQGGLSYRGPIGG